MTSKSLKYVLAYLFRFSAEYLCQKHETSSQMCLLVSLGTATACVRCSGLSTKPTCLVSWPSVVRGDKIWVAFVV